MDWEAHLQGANFTAAKLQGADLGGAFIGGTIFSETQSRLRNLQTVSCEPLKIDDWKKLRKEIARALPERARRDDVLNRLEELLQKNQNTNGK